MSYGWVGNTARINLTSGQVTVEPSERYHQAFLGGKGINARVLWNEVKPETRPLDPENTLTIGTESPGRNAGADRLQNVPSRPSHR